MKRRVNKKHGRISIPRKSKKKEYDETLCE